MHTEILIPWTTVSGGTSVTSVIQDHEAYIDTGGASDVVFYVDVLNVHQDEGTTVILTLESSPTNDAALFLPVAGPITLSPSMTPLIFKTVPGAVSLAPLARWLRWHVTTSSTQWTVTFRVRASRSRTPFFSPTLISGCALWLRADLGTSISTGVSAWADQSGVGDANRNYEQSTGSAQPTLNAHDAAYNGQATLSFLPSSSQCLLATGAFSPTVPSPFTVFIVGNDDGVVTSTEVVFGETGITYMECGDNFYYISTTSDLLTAKPRQLELTRFPGRRMEQVCSRSPTHGKTTKTVHRRVQA
jgi:hypothetical protein